MCLMKFNFSSSVSLEDGDFTRLPLNLGAVLDSIVVNSTCSMEFTTLALLHSH